MGEPAIQKPKGDRLWQRSLQNDRVEAYCALDENYIHIIARPSVVQSALQALSEQTNHPLPMAEIRGKRRKSRGPLPLDGQLGFEDGGDPDG